MTSINSFNINDEESFINAESILYNDTSTLLNATNVQSSIEKTIGKIEQVENKITGGYNFYNIAKEIYITGDLSDPSKEVFLNNLRLTHNSDGQYQLAIHLLYNDYDYKIDITTSSIEQIINSINNGNSCFYDTTKHIIIYRNNNMWHDVTFSYYITLDIYAMELGVDYGDRVNSLSEKFYDLKNLPIINDYINQTSNILENISEASGFTDDFETNKYLKELYLYGSGVDTSKTYYISSFSYLDRDDYPIFFRISDGNDNVIQVNIGSNIPDVYSTAGSNYNNSGVYIKYIIDYERLGRGNSVSYFRNNGRVYAHISSKAFNINNCPLIRAYDEIMTSSTSGISSALISEFYSNVYDFENEVTQDFPNDNESSIGMSKTEFIDNNGNVPFVVCGDGSVEFPYGINDLKLRISDNLYKIGVDETSLTLTLEQI